MPRSEKREFELGGHKYTAKDKRRSPAEQSAWMALGQRRPARTTTYRSKDKTAPEIHATTTNSQYRMNAPVVGRRLTSQEAHDQRKKNMALSVAGGAGVGRLARSGVSTFQTHDPNAPRGLFGQVKHNFSEGKKNPDRLSAAETDRAARSFPGKHMPYAHHIRNVDPDEPKSFHAYQQAKRKMSLVAPINVHEAKRAYLRGAKKNAAYVGGGMALGAAYGANKWRRSRNKPNPYTTAYSTQGMKRIL